ncbi:hypothetical protein CCACVL1_10168 [Corchorus capsularis]|uniref:Uncharacterized protein n=1 Tax=Corchorus capsularis TaxID=210143 RepID=A0A1R3ISD5_COCAP|nr:hypothetical protein CCACVL1_10168 [Corchorus capsularis]
MACLMTIYRSHQLRAHARMGTCPHGVITKIMTYQKLSTTGT